ncbi:MAG: tyrosine-type recombinase/integrase [Nanoarchaeota archaeon]
MKKEYPKFKRGEVERYFSELPKKEQTEIEDYVRYRQARGITSNNPLMDLRRHVIQLRFIFGEPISKLTLKDLREYLALLTRAKLKEHTKNDIKVNIKNFLKYKFKDWSQRFTELEDIRLSSNTRNEEKLNSKTILKKEDIETLMKNESKMFWKAFFITQYEAGLRTKETRLLKWDDIKFNVDGEISEILIFATKTKKARPVFVKEATHYLKLLKEQQERTEEKGVYVFHSKSDLNKPIDRNSISVWMRGLSKKCGIHCWNYLLRHSRATELYRLAKQGKIAKDTALAFMGHSADMSEVYTHLDESEIKKMLKDQVYKLEELPPKEKREFEEKLEELSKKQESLQAELESRKDYDSVLNDLLSLPQVQEILKRKKKLGVVGK